MADLGFIYAYTDSSKPYKGMSAFIVDMHSRASAAAPPPKRWAGTPAPLASCSSTRWSAGREPSWRQGGAGLRLRDGRSGQHPAHGGGRGPGVSQGLIEEAVKYAQAREQFGQAIGKFRWCRRSWPA